MKIVDISVPISSEMVCYPGNTPVTLTRQYDTSRGDPLNVTDLCLSAHTGTHVDAPLHHIPGQQGIAEMGLRGLVGRAYVADLRTSKTAIRKADLSFIAVLDHFDILLLKTHNSFTKTSWQEFDSDHVYLAQDAAEFLVSLNVQGVGIDCLSVEQYANPDGAAVHKILMQDNAVTVIEGLDLRSIDSGYYFFSCLPIPVVQADGAPARAILIPEEDLCLKPLNLGVRRDGSYYTRITWASHTTESPLYWVSNLIDDDLERFGGTWGANTMGPANVILDFFGETQEIGMIRIFHNVGAPVSILEELAREIKIYVSDDDKCVRFGDCGQDPDSIVWQEIACLSMQMAEGWTSTCLTHPVNAKYIRLELVANFGTPEHLPWVETSELKIYPPRSNQFSSK